MRVEEARKAQIQADVVSAEKRRLQTLMQYLMLNSQNEKKSGRGAREERDEGRGPKATWALQPAPGAYEAGAIPMCGHGMYTGAVPVQGTAGYLDVCPHCCGDQILATHGQLAPQAIQQIAQYTQHKNQYPQVSQYNDPYGAYNPQQIVDAGSPYYAGSEAPNALPFDPRALANCRLRPARNQREMPTSPKPIAPPGYITVPMVIEGLAPR